MVTEECYSSVELDLLLNLPEDANSKRTELNMIIAARIGDLMEENFITKKDLKEYLKTSYRNINELLAGVKDYNINIISKLTFLFQDDIILIPTY